MTVRELVNKLINLVDQDAIVVMARDEEGNSFDELRVVESCGWNAEWKELIDPEDKEDEDAYKSAICLWP